jgi:hypothetical protein
VSFCLFGTIRFGFILKYFLFKQKKEKAKGFQNRQTQHVKTQINKQTKSQSNLLSKTHKHTG